MSQKIATGFNRCNVTTSEGGSIPEEYRVRYAVDRVETLATVWMGLTLGCTVCHDHKFDPFTQKEFYQLFAYYNNVDENPMDGNALLPPPIMKVPTPEQAARQAELDAAIAQKQAVVDGALPDIDVAQSAWETEWSEQLRDRWQMLEPAAIHIVGRSDPERIGGLLSPRRREESRPRMITKSRRPRTCRDFGDSLWRH